MCVVFSVKHRTAITLDKLINIAKLLALEDYFPSYVAS